MRSALFVPLLLSACSVQALVAPGEYALTTLRTGQGDLAPPEATTMQVSTEQVEVLWSSGSFRATPDILAPADWLRGCPTQMGDSALETWVLATGREPLLDGFALTRPLLVAECDGTDGPADRLVLTSGDTDERVGPCARTPCYVFELTDPADASP